MLVFPFYVHVVTFSLIFYPILPGLHVCTPMYKSSEAFIIIPAHVEWLAYMCFVSMGWLSFFALPTTLFS